MIHSGQEYARSKVIPFNEPEEDPHKGMIDHNSYDKDNETNYINYNHVKTNQDLFNYYKGLIEIRRKYDAFRRADYSDVSFINYKDKPFVLGYSVKYKNEEFLVLFNANPISSFKTELPEGEWDILADENSAGTKSLQSVKSKITLNSSTGMILKKK